MNNTNRCQGNKLKPCPFCGNKVHIDKRPLWSGNHGYQGCYEYIIECKNRECGCSLQTKGIDTIYRDDETARNNAIQAWNRRV